MKTNVKQSTIKGTSLSEGISIGKAFLYHDILTRDISSYYINSNDVTYEMKRINNSLLEVRKELYSLSKSVSENISSNDGDIFESQRLIIEDEAFVLSFKKEMNRELINAEQVVKNVFHKQIELFNESSNEIVKAKADDFRDILRKILHSLLGIDTNVLSKLPKDAILIARRLFPSDTVMLDKKNIEGILVQEGSIHAHSALLARSIGIPALCLDGQPIDTIQTGDTIIIDGYTGETFINPNAKTVETYTMKKEKSSIEVKKKAKVLKGVVKTNKGRTIKMYANASTIDEIKQAKDKGCDGIGLIRTETIYLQHETMPNEETLFSILSAAIQPMGNKPVTIRLLDIGGDKRLPYFSFEEDFSPFLGLRGVRLLLKNPELLSVQLRALLRLSEKKKINVLIPMISIPEEIIKVREMLKKCSNEIDIKTTNIKIGSMIETPSAAIAIEEIIKVCDFVSIGTNDLTQYIMAASRENPNVAGLYEKGIDYILPLIKNIAQVCKEAKKQCSVCGEITNNEKHLKQFVECGIENFSVSPFRIPHLKEYIQGLDL